MLKDITAEDLLSDVSEAIVIEDIANKKDNIRRMLMKEKQLIEDKDKKEKELAKLEKSIIETQEKIAKFKSWDWSILNQFSSKPQSIPTESTPNN